MSAPKEMFDALIWGLPLIQNSGGLRSTIDAKNAPFNNVHLVSFLVSIVLYNLVSVVQIVIGALHLHECQLEPMVPIYLIGAGGMALLIQIYKFTFQLSWKQGTHPKCGWRIFYILSFINFGWFIAGNYFVFHIFKPNTDPTAGPFCHEHVFYLAFVCLMLWYGFLCLCCCFPCCILYLGLLAFANQTVNQVGNHGLSDSEADLAVVKSYDQPDPEMKSSPPTPPPFDYDKPWSGGTVKGFRKRQPTVAIESGSEHGGSRYNMGSDASGQSFFMPDPGVFSAEEDDWEIRQNRRKKKGKAFMDETTREMINMPGPDVFE